jgi:hypothetical protein
VKPIYKCICDVCRSNEANQHFKVKKLSGVWTWRGRYEASEWAELDICNQCYEKFIGVIHEREDRERMMEAFIGKPHKENNDK